MKTELRDALDEVADILSERRRNSVWRAVGAILENVVEKAGGNRVVVHPQLRKRLGDAQRMRDVRVARLPELPGVGSLRDIVGVPDLGDVGLGPLFADKLYQLEKPFRLLPVVGYLKRHAGR